MTPRSKKAFREGKCCENCGSRSNLTIDHLKPRMWGNAYVGNSQILCEKCNRDKGNLTIDYSTRTLTVEPYWFKLQKPDLIYLLNKPLKFSCEFFNPGAPLYNKYRKRKGLRVLGKVDIARTGSKSRSFKHSKYEVVGKS